MNEERQAATGPGDDPADETHPEGASADPNGAGTEPDGAQAQSTTAGEHAEWDKRVRDRLTRQGEEAIGKLAQGVLEHPVVTGAVSAAFDARARALRAQEAAMAALNLPSASDLERLTRRLRSVSQRMEAVEEGLDRLEEGVQQASGKSLERRIEQIEASLARIEAALGGPASPGGAGGSGGSAGPPRPRQRGTATDPAGRPQPPEGGATSGGPSSRSAPSAADPDWRSPWQR
jgi:hypothetical protein